MTSNLKKDLASKFITRAELFLSNAVDALVVQVALLRVREKAVGVFALLVDARGRLL